MKKLKYNYDPGRQALTIMEGDKPRGGYHGANAETKFSELLETGAEISIQATMDTKKAKIRRIRAIWIQKGIDRYRDGILENYGVTSTKDLSEQQLDELIRRFSDRDPGPVIRALRSQVLIILTRLGVYENDGSWDNVNALLMDKRIAGKLLYQMDERELKQLIRKLSAIEAKENISKNINLN